MFVYIFCVRGEDIFCEKSCFAGSMLNYAPLKRQENILAKDMSECVSSIHLSSFLPFSPAFSGSLWRYHFNENPSETHNFVVILGISDICGSLKYLADKKLALNWTYLVCNQKSFSQPCFVGSVKKRAKKSG